MVHSLEVYMYTKEQGKKSFYLFLRQKSNKRKIKKKKEKEKKR